MSDQLQPQRLRIGEGRISGYLSIFLAVLSLGAVICFHFPEYFTTPDFRPGGLLRRCSALGVARRPGPRLMDRRNNRPMDTESVAGSGSAMGHGGRMGRVELLAVGESGPGGARMAEWDGGRCVWELEVLQDGHNHEQVGDDGSTEFGVRSQHSVVPVAMDARGRYEPSEPLEELNR